MQERRMAKDFDPEAYDEEMNFVYVIEDTIIP